MARLYKKLNFGYNVNALETCMLKNKLKIKKQISLVILGIIFSGLLNVCLVTLGAKAAGAAPAPTFSSDFETCSLMAMPVSDENLERPDIPMPSCCLERGRYYDAIINTDNNKEPPLFLSAAFGPASGLALNNFSLDNPTVLIYPPPALGEISTTIIRE